ncbi:MAG: succinate dehydrogenase assembly factor 2 [Dokdonella sp.]
MDAEFKRLRWRCRRGTRELDQLLGGWLENRYETASPAMQKGFSGLLEQQDPELWDWLLGNGQASDPDQAAVIDEIRTQHRV